MENGKILCAGLLCLDVVSYVEKYPLEDSDNHCSQVWVLGGNACNNSNILTQSGTPCSLFSTICEDHTYPFVSQRLSESSIDASLCVIRKNHLLPVSVCIVSLANGSRTILHCPYKLKEASVEEFREKINLNDFSWINFEGRNLAEVRKMMDYILKFRGEGAVPKISVEIEKKKANIENLIPGADFVFLSKEFSQNRGFSDMQSAVNGIWQQHADKNGPASVIICAWGEKGACARLQNGRIVQSSSYPPEKLVDTLGAGDTFLAATILKLNQGVDVEEAITFGCQLAGKKCGQMGFSHLF